MILTASTHLATIAFILLFIPSRSSVYGHSRKRTDYIARQGGGKGKNSEAAAQKSVIDRAKFERGDDKIYRLRAKNIEHWPDFRGKIQSP
jgi:hypothetical protein